MTHGVMRRHCSTVCAASFAEVEAETLGYSLSDSQELVETLSDYHAEVEEESEGDTWGDAQALFDTVAESLAEV